MKKITNKFGGLLGKKPAADTTSKVSDSSATTDKKAVKTKRKASSIFKKPTKAAPKKAGVVTKTPKRSGSLSQPLLVALAIIVLALIGYFLYQLLTGDDEVAEPVTVTEVNPTIDSSKNEPAPETIPSAAQDSTLPPANETKPDVNPALTAPDTVQPFDPESVPKPEAIINAELPPNNSLAKEEIDRLNDEYLRLNKQEQIGRQQTELMEELTEKKAEQIELLEKQIAQLEAQK